MMVGFVLGYSLPTTTPCTSNPCQNNGSCEVRSNGFVCNCTGTGFQGDTCIEGMFFLPCLFVFAPLIPGTREW